MINRFKTKSEFNRNVITLMTGSTIAQAIPIAISPILTRIYTPEDFGIFALFVAIISIFGVIANGKYELAIILPNKDEDAINIFALGLLISVFISLILLILVFLLNDFFTQLLGNSEIGFWLYFVPIAVFFSGLFNVLNYFNTRKKNYKDLRNATILKSIVLVMVQVSVGFMKQGVSGLISGQIISNMFANMKLLNNILKDKILISKISKVKMIAMAKRYKKFPKISLFSSLCDNATLQSTSLVFPILFGVITSGFFFLAKKIVFMPFSVIGISFSQVFLKQLSDAKKNKSDCMRLFKLTFFKLSLISFVISVIIFMLAPFAFEFVFGSQWRFSGEIARYLSVVFFISFVVSPLSAVFVATEELSKGALWQYTYLFTTIVLFLVFFIFNLDFNLFLLIYVIHEVILYIFYFYLIYNSLQKLK